MGLENLGGKEKEKIERDAWKGRGWWAGIFGVIFMRSKSGQVISKIKGESSGM